jgi:hopanoid biosynthesis associated protein HpnK
VRRLIINADDFGLTAGVNRGILEAHQHGAVSSTTLMANAEAFSGAVSLAQKTPTLAVGCHVVLVDGKPVSDPREVPSLMEGEHFPSGFGAIAKRAFAGKLDSREVQSEIAAQIRRIRATGINVSHLDSHKHTHILPQVLKPLLAAARDCGVRAVRNPFEGLTIQQLMEHPGTAGRWLAFKTLGGFAGKFRDAVRRSELVTADGTVGMLATGSLDETWFQQLARNLPQGTWELVCHPGYDDTDLRNVKTRLTRSRAVELEALGKPSAREFLGNCGIELISYRDLK